MNVPRLSLPAILTVAICLLAGHPLEAGPYVPPGFTPVNYTLIPQTGVCEERIQRIERTLEKIAKKVGVELEPRIVTLHNTQLITRADGVTVLDESCLTDPSTVVLDIIRQIGPAEDKIATELKTLEDHRAVLLGQLLKSFDELRATDDKIERLKRQPDATK